MQQNWRTVFCRPLELLRYKDPSLVIVFFILSWICVSQKKDYTLFFHFQMGKQRVTELSWPQPTMVMHLRWPPKLASSQAACNGRHYGHCLFFYIQFWLTLLFLTTGIAEHGQSKSGFQKKQESIVMRFVVELCQENVPQLIQLITQPTHFCCISLHRAEESFPNPHPPCDGTGFSANMTLSNF